MSALSSATRLLDVAVDHFGRLGRDGASTRAIARGAGTQMSAITYHFGGKEGLYLAAAEHTAAQLRTMIEPMFEPASDLIAGGKYGDDARDSIRGIISSMAMLISDESAAVSRFVLRELADPTEAFERIYSCVMEEVLDRLACLIMRAANDQLPEASARILAMTLVGQVLVFRFARATVMTGMGWKQFGSDETALSCRIILANLDAILDKLAIEGAE